MFILVLNQIVYKLVKKLTNLPLHEVCILYYTNLTHLCFYVKSHLEKIIL